MARLLIHVEGQTEEDFVNEVLRDQLMARGYDAVDARIVGNARLRRRRGGIRAWPSVRKDIINHLREDPGCIVTTMVDYYGLPQKDAAAWPGRARAGELSPAKRAPCVEEALLNDLVAKMGKRLNPRRFVPFVVMHEFEGLLFSDCAGFSSGIGQPNLEADFRAIRDQFSTPEEITMIRRSPLPPNASRLSCPGTKSRFSARWQCWKSGWRVFERSARTSIAGWKSLNRLSNVETGS
jgi:hypothetical protein